jgi:hypothetical protein
MRPDPLERPGSSGFVLVVVDRDFGAKLPELPHDAAADPARASRDERMLSLE